MASDEEGESVERALKAEQKLESNKRFTAVSLWWIGALLLYILLIYQFPLPDGRGEPAWKWPEWAREFRADLGHALVTFFAFGAFYDQVFKRAEVKSLQRGLLFAMGASSRVFATMSANAKRLHLKNSLISLLGKDIGEALFGDVIEPVILADAGFRRHYSYCVTMLEREAFPDLASFGALTGTGDPSTYHWLREEMEYQKFLPSHGRIFRGPFKIVLTFDRETLYELYNSQEIYFRVLIDLDDATRAALFDLPDDRIETFVRQVMGFSAAEFSGNKRQVPYKILVDRVTRGGLVTILTNSLVDKSPLNRLKVAFSYPHQRNATHYTFSLPQPCQSPQMQFYACGSVEGLEMTEYLSNIPRDRVHVTRNRPDRNVRSIAVKVDGWVFPLSGITFTWRNR